MSTQKTSKTNLPQNPLIGPDPLPDEKLNLRLNNEFFHWKIVNSHLPKDTFIVKKELYRSYNFNDFDSVILFISKVAVGCNIFPHHPRWKNTWTTLKVWLSKKSTIILSGLLPY